MSAIGPEAVMSGQRACRACGCTATRACNPPCWWVERDLCSACAGSAELTEDELEPCLCCSGAGTVLLSAHPELWGDDFFAEKDRFVPCPDCKVEIA